jgi:hypothetical protein
MDLIYIQELDEEEGIEQQRTISMEGRRGRKNT